MGWHATPRYGMGTPAAHTILLCTCSALLNMDPSPIAQVIPDINFQSCIQNQKDRKQGKRERKESGRRTTRTKDTKGAHGPRPVHETRESGKWEGWHLIARCLFFLSVWSAYLSYGRQSKMRCRCGCGARDNFISFLFFTLTKATKANAKHNNKH